MESVCHRCGEYLVPNQIFCPHCGAPHLLVDENDSLPAGQDPSLQQSLDRAADLLRWRSAVTAALFVAVPVALLSTLVSIGALWVFIGGFLTVHLYRRRTASPTDGRIGWRIGSLTGVISAIFWLALNAVSMLVQRYALHQGAAIDAAFTNAVKSAMATMNQQSPTFQHQFPWFAGFWLSPSGIATLYLTGTSLVAVSMVLFAALGGALGGSYHRNRPLNPPSM